MQARRGRLRSLHLAEQLTGLTDGNHIFSVRGKSADGVTGAAVVRNFEIGFAACNSAEADLSDAQDAADAALAKKKQAKKKLQKAKKSGNKKKIKKAKKKYKKAKKKLKTANATVDQARRPSTRPAERAPRFGAVAAADVEAGRRRVAGLGGSMRRGCRAMTVRLIVALCGVTCLIRASGAEASSLSHRVTATFRALKRSTN